MRAWIFIATLAGPALAQEPTDDEHLELSPGAEPVEVAAPALSACEATCRTTHAECRAQCLELAPGSPADPDFRDGADDCAACGEAASTCIAGCSGP